LCLESSPVPPLPPKKRPPKNRSKSRPKGPSSAQPGRASQEVRVRWVEAERAWELVHPRCALERSEDLEEVEQMVALGERDIAIDELRWLLGGCSDFIAAHARLGELALAEGDPALARGHFGQAFRVGEQALRRAKAQGPLPYRLEANQPFHAAGKGLVTALLVRGKSELARQVADQIVRLDPSDPLEVRKLFEGPAEDAARGCAGPS
jgi:tetratricopeptide (TPR) repeat protein